MPDWSCTRRELIVGSAAAGACFSFGRALAQPSGLAGLTIEEASKLIRSRAISSVELVRAYVERIGRFNPQFKRLHHGH